MELDEATALNAYARAINGLSIGPLEGILASDFHYASQQVFGEITSKQEFLDYLGAKLRSVADSGGAVFAEIGQIDAYGRERPCVVLAQGDTNNLVAYVLAEVANGEVQRLDLCVVPSPDAAVRSGIYPR